MNDDNRRDGGGDETGDVDPGEPIQELADLEETPTPGFFQRLVDSIERRLLGADLIDLARRAVREFFHAYWNLVMSLLKGDEKDDGGAQS